jgi:hypothetical protein
MSIQYGYYVDTSSITLDDNIDGLVAGWVHALPVGEYQHPVFGKLSFTADRIKRFAESVAKRVRGIDPDIDYDHKAKTGAAAGWVKNAVARADGLWLQVGWTPSAATELKEKKYRYFSADFHDEWTDPKGNKHQDVINGGSLTNRPYLKDLMPVNLSELTFSEPEPPKEGAMDYAKLRKLLNLPDNTTDEAVDAALVNRLTVQQPGPQVDPSNPPNPAPWSPPPAQPEGAQPPQNPFLSEAAMADLATKLGDNHPAIVMMRANADALATQSKQLAEMQTAIKLSETSRKLGEVQSKASQKGIGIGPALLDEARAVLLSCNDATAARVYSLLDKLADNTGIVQLGEIGSIPQTPGSRTGETDAWSTFDNRAKKLMEENKGLQFSDAIERAIRENPDLYAQYRRDSYLAE